MIILKNLGYHEPHNSVYNHRLLIEIQALEGVQGTIQDLILNNVTTDWPVYNDNDDNDDDDIVEDSYFLLIVFLVLERDLISCTIL
jgi:hypothetical protein